MNLKHVVSILVMLIVAIPLSAVEDDLSKRRFYEGRSIAEVAVSTADYPANRRYSMYDGKGRRPANAVPDDKVVFLYNVKYKKFLTMGDIWGTMAIMGNIGTPFLMREYRNVREYADADSGTAPTTVTRYTLETLELADWVENSGANKYLGYVKNFKNPENNSQIHYSRLYVDRNMDGSNKGSLNYFDFVPYTEEENNKTYMMEYYTEVWKRQSSNWNKPVANSKSTLCPLPDQTIDYFRFDYPMDGNTILLNSREKAEQDSIGIWKLITLQDIKDDMRRRYRINTPVTNLSNYIRYNDFGGAFISGEFFQENAWRVSAGDNGSVAIVPNVRNGNEQLIYRYGKLHSSNSTPAHVTLSQDVYVEKAGWYLITSKAAVIRSREDSDVNGFLFAELINSTDNRSRKETFIKDVILNNEVGNNTSLGQLMYYSTHYKQGVAVFVPTDGPQWLTIGARAENVTNNDYLAIDDFGLYYFGNSNNYLDEDEVDATYISKQLEADQLLANKWYKSNLTVQRNFKPHQWNSFTLPVNLTKEQFVNAFGPYVKLAHFEGQDPERLGRLLFRTINLNEANDTAVVFQAKNLYLVYPEKEMEQSSMTETFAGYTIRIDGTTVSFMGVEFNPNEISDNSTPFEVPFRGARGGYEDVAFVGTFFNTDNAITPGCYFLGADDNWYYTSKSYRSKGLRGWIKPLTETSVRPVMRIEGIVKDFTTGITETVVIKQEKNNNVYNMNGQLVRTNGVLDGLPRGIYIVGGKKVVVK